MAQQRTSCRTTRALVLVLIVLLLACGIVTAGYLPSPDHKNGITREKQHDLLAVADLKSRNSTDVRLLPDPGGAPPISGPADSPFSRTPFFCSLLLGGFVATLLLAAGLCVFLLWWRARLRCYREHMAVARQTERELQQKQQELEALNRSLEQRVREELERNREKDHLLIQQSRLAAMGEMIGNIAHQWRQPLNVVGLLFQSLPESRRTGELTEEYLDEIVRQAMEVIGYMSRTMNDFRNFFKPDKEKTEFILRDVVDRSISFLQPHLHYHNIEITVRITDGLSVNGYPNEYSQVLINILGNAKDIFLERGTEQPAIAITAHEEGGRTVVTVTDNAGGVPDEILPRIFDPYFTCKRSGDGTGLGLYMSKTIIEKNMQGMLSARNTGCGAEFRIEV